MTVTIVRQADLVRMPWKNGGGTTAEIAIAPAGADLGDFDWRISMADVATEGPFSTFPGIDRTLTLIEGASLVLDVEGKPHRLDASRRSLSFPGEARTGARLPSGLIRDLNVMTRRAVFTHRVGSWEGAGSLETVLVIVAMADAVTIEADGRTHRLDRLDTIIFDPCPVTCAISGAAIPIEIAGA